MIEEKMRTSKLYRKIEVRACPNSIKSPIVVLQRLQFGANCASLPEAAKDKPNIPVQKEIQGKTKKYKNYELNDLDTIINNLKNVLETSPLNYNKSKESKMKLQSTHSAPNGTNTLPENKSYKFKKKLKCLQEKQSNKKFNTQSGNKLNSNRLKGTQQKLKDKIRVGPEISTDNTTIKKAEIKTTASTKKELPTKTNDFRKRNREDQLNHSEKNNLPQEQINSTVSLNANMSDETESMNNSFKTNETIQIIKSISTRSKLLKKMKIDDPKKCNIEVCVQQSSTPNISKAAIPGTSLLHEKVSRHSKNYIGSNLEDNKGSDSILTEKKKGTTDECKLPTSNSFLVEMDDKIPGTEMIVEAIPMTETTNACEEIIRNNFIKTRSKVIEKTIADGSEHICSSRKFAQKQESNKSPLTEKVLKQQKRTIDSVGSSINTKRTISKRSKLTDTKKTDEHGKSLIGSEMTESAKNNSIMNVSEIQMDKELSEVEKILDNSNLSTNLTVEPECAPVTTEISTRSKVLEKMEIDSNDKLKTRRSSIRNEITESVLNSSISCSSPKKVIHKLKDVTDPPKTEENVTLEKKIPSRRTALKKKEEDHKNCAVRREIVQPEKNHSASSSSVIPIDNEPSVSEKILDPLTNSSNLNTAEKKITAQKIIPTRSSGLDTSQKAIDLEKNPTESEISQPKIVHPTLPVSNIEKSHKSSSGELNNQSEFAIDSIQMKINDTISMSSKLLETKIDNEEKQIAKPISDNTMVHLTRRQTRSINNECLLNEKLLDSSKHLTGRPKKVGIKSITPAKSKPEGNKMNHHKKSTVENEATCLEQSQSTSEVSSRLIADQFSSSEPIRDDPELLPDLPKTKKDVYVINTIATRSKRKSIKKNESEKYETHNEIVLSKQETSNLAETQITSKTSLIKTPLCRTRRSTDPNKYKPNVDIGNTFPTRSKFFENKQKDDHHKDTSENKTSQSVEIPSNNNSSIRKAVPIRNRLLKKRDIDSHEKSIVENEAACVEKSKSPLNSSHKQSKIEIANEIFNNSELLPDVIKTDVGIRNRISTRRNTSKKTKIDKKFTDGKERALNDNNHFPSKSTQIKAHNEPTKRKQIVINNGDNVVACNNSLENEKNVQSDCNTKKHHQVCFEKQIVIKLFRCELDRQVNDSSVQKQAVKRKSLIGKRKAVNKITLKETPQAKKLKQVDSSPPGDESIDLPTVSENEHLAVENINIADISKSVPEPQSILEPNVTDDVTKCVENISQDHEVAEKDLHQENLLNSNIVEKIDCVTQILPENEIQCVNKRAESTDGIVEHSSNDHINEDEINLHSSNNADEENITKDRDERISFDTSKNKINAETIVAHNGVIIEENTPTASNEENHHSLSRTLVEEVINDWSVADDDKADDIDDNGINESSPLSDDVQIIETEDLDIIVAGHQQTVSTEQEGTTKEPPSNNSTAKPRKNAETSSTTVPGRLKEQMEQSNKTLDTNSTVDSQRSDMERETSDTTSAPEKSPEISETEDVEDSNFESLDENSCTEMPINENLDDHDNDASQETITYYNSEDITTNIDVPADSNGLNDVVMSLKDACDKITADLSSAVCENDEEQLSHPIPELLYISDDSVEEVEPEEEDIIIIEPPSESYNQPSLNENQRSLLISNTLNQVLQQQNPSISFIKASQLQDEILRTPQEYPAKQSGQQVVVYPQRPMQSTTLLPASVMPDNSTELPTDDSIIKCPKCQNNFIGKTRLRRHWLTCGDAMYLNCPFCIHRVKQRRSLMNHITTHHPNQVTKEQVVKIVEHIVRQTREAAGVVLTPGVPTPLYEMLPTAPSPPIIELPAYIRIQCVMCNKLYDEMPATYKKNCDACSSDLMTAICQLCQKKYTLSPKVAIHVQGNCIFSGRIKCSECDFIANSRYHLQEHISRKHTYVAPEDYFMCSRCEKTFRIVKALKKHERICGKEADLQCKFCEYKSKHRSAMKMHVQQHIVNEKVTVGSDGKVNICGSEKSKGQELKSSSEDEVRDLITEKEVRSVIRVHCTRCNRTLRLTSNRSSCEYCKLSFTFSCSRCSESLRMESLHSVRLHVIRTHCVKSHECQHCAAKFSYVYDLTKHVSKCGGRHFSCGFCSFRTIKEENFRSHMSRVHFSNSDSHICNKCGKIFGRYDGLRRHQKWNCGVEPNFSCEHCRFRTKTKFSLLRHIQSQHAYIYENFNFVCDRCNKFYTNMFSYEEHVKNCHALIKN